MNVPTQTPSDRALLGGGFTIHDLVACCLPIVLLVASIASLL